MRIHFGSDLHLEFLRKRFPSEIRMGRLSAEHADVMVLAGDIHSSTEAIGVFADWPCPVLYVPGNHEFYDETIEPTLRRMRQLASGTSVQILDCDEVVLHGVRFLGCTLWTDYLLNGGGEAQRWAMRSCESMMADHRKIHGRSSPSERFTPVHAAQIHGEHRAWLESALRRGSAGAESLPTVVITHHGPHVGSIHERFSDNPCNAGFISHLDDLVAQADLWIHGHVHDSFDYRVGKCRVVTNPGGYAGGLARAKRIEEISWENPAFDPFRVVEL